MEQIVIKHIPVQCVELQCDRCRGTIYLCGNYVFCPDDRFVVIYTDGLFKDGGTECKH